MGKRRKKNSPLVQYASVLYNIWWCTSGVPAFRSPNSIVNIPGTVSLGLTVFSLAFRPAKNEKSGQSHETFICRHISRATSVDVLKLCTVRKIALIVNKTAVVRHQRNEIPLDAPLYNRGCCRCTYLWVQISKIALHRPGFCRLPALCTCLKWN